ncbi:phage integrase N-terminal SAM-like domain-containing protein [Streptomyces sp. NPDC089919]|uniref:phage integrase N-terminal SAM-like domain-containing protein n=1 Tax=Streptomyces sp. NPDC089919 TaxID=3155188 RepID=UPI003424A7AC
MEPGDAVSEAMLAGWERHQREARGLRPGTIARRRRIVARFTRFTGAHPWHWTPADLDRWLAVLAARGNRTKATLDAYRGAVRQFTGYLLDPAHGWEAVCRERFGTSPAPLLPKRRRGAARERRATEEGNRPMTREEARLFFEDIDDRAGWSLRRAGSIRQESGRSPASGTVPR